VITGRRQGNHFNVKLDDGREVVAVIPKSAWRIVGSFQAVLGHRVTVVHRTPPKPPKIVEMSRPD